MFFKTLVKRTQSFLFATLKNIFFLRILPVWVLVIFYRNLSQIRMFKYILIRFIIWVCKTLSFFTFLYFAVCFSGLWSFEISVHLLLLLLPLLFTDSQVKRSAAVVSCWSPSLRRKAAELSWRWTARRWWSARCWLKIFCRPCRSDGAPYSQHPPAAAYCIESHRCVDISSTWTGL